MGWRRKKGQLTEASQFFVMSYSALCHIRNDEISACEWRVQPLMNICPSSDLIGQAGTWWQWAPAVKLCWNLAGQLTWASTAGICVWAGLAQLGFVVELLWAWLSLQNEEFCYGWYTWAFVVSWLWKNKHRSHKFCWEKYSWEVSNLYFPWVGDISIYFAKK